MKLPSQYFNAINTCFADPNDDSKDKIQLGFYRTGNILFFYPGFHWGTIINLTSGFSFLTDKNIDFIKSITAMTADYVCVPMQLVSEKDKKEVEGYCSIGGIAGIYPDESGCCINMTSGKTLISSLTCSELFKLMNKNFIK